MEPKFQKSFIPKASLAKEPERAAKSRTAAMGLVTLAGLVLFLAAVALSVGVFLYQQFLEQSIQSKNESLTRAREAFEPALLEELARLDKRLSTAQRLLDNHLAPSAFFTVLEESTLQDVRFETLSYTVLEDERISISMNGEAKSFAAVALQSDIFGNSRAIREPIFSNLNVNQQGNIVFTLSALLDSNFIRYNATLDTREQPASTDASESQIVPRTVSIVGQAFTPDNITVQKGATVTFVNNDTVPHTVTSDADSPSNGLASETLQPGDAYEFTFDGVGTYNYHCEIHPSMLGVITVIE